MKKRSPKGCDICEGRVTDSSWPPPDRITRSHDGLSALHWCPACDAYWEFTMDDERVITYEEAQELFPWAFDERRYGRKRKRPAHPAQIKQVEMTPEPAQGILSPAVEPPGGAPGSAFSAQPPRQQLLFGNYDTDMAEVYQDLRAVRSQLQDVSKALAALAAHQRRLLERTNDQDRLLGEIYSSLLSSDRLDRQKPS